MHVHYRVGNYDSYLHESGPQLPKDLVTVEEEPLEAVEERLVLTCNGEEKRREE